MPNPRVQPTGRAAVLDLVKREGPIAAEALAEKLGITAMAVRQHLAGLEAEELATHEARPAARGRPAKYWRATEKASAHFPDSHALLATDLLGQMKKAFGDKGLDALLKLRTIDQAQTYGEALRGAATLKARLEALAAVRSREGY